MIDIAKLPPPAVVEALSFEEILSAILADYQARYPEGDALLASDPAYKLAEVAAYREVLLRARVNDAARAVMLASAKGADLDHLGALLGVARAEDESDNALLLRIQSAPEAFSVAGPVGAYSYLARQVAPTAIKDVAVLNPEPGRVRVVLLSSAGDGTPTPELLDAVGAALSAEEVRPLCDTVEVVAPSIMSYDVTAVLKVYPGPDPEVARAKAQADVSAFVQDQHRLGRDIVASAVMARLYVPGVQRAQLVAPAADLLCASDEAAWCASISVTLGGVDE